MRHPDDNLEGKYEQGGRASIRRPDLKLPGDWSLSLVTAVNRVRNHALSPNGKLIAFIWDREDLSDIYVLPSSGGWPRRLTTARGLVPFWDDELPRWSPDSNHLAFTLDGYVHTFDIKTGTLHKITDFSASASSPMWMPDGRGLLVSVERHEANQLLLTDSEGGWPRALTDSSTGDAGEAQPAPDGKQVAFVERPFNDLNRSDICLYTVEDGSLHRLTDTTQVFNHTPRWRPATPGQAGATLAYLSQKSGWFEIWIVHPGAGEPQQLTHTSMDLSGICWSPDGSRLACIVNRQGAFELALVDAASGEIRVIAGGNGVYSNPNWPSTADFLTVEYENPLQPPDLYRIDLKTRRMKQLTFSNLPVLEHLRMVTPQQVSYRSFDGLEIPAFLYLPEKSNGAAVVYPHGGPSDQYGFSWDIFPQYLLAKGYTYLAPNYRGSTGYGIEFEHANYNDWGKGDLQDCLHAARFLGKLADVDPGRLAIYGGSYGGYMAICALARDPDYLFACGVSKYGDSNLVSSWAQCSRRLRLYTEVYLGHPAANRQVYLDGSPIYQVENVRRPMLILHGLLDDIVPPQASEEWVEALKRHGKTFEYKTYPDEPHGFLRRANLEDALARIERFLDWYLLPA